MPVPRQYVDFPIMIGQYAPHNDTYEVSMPPTTQWGEPDPVTLQLKRAEIETSLRALEGDMIAPEALIALGKGLADRLLPPGTLRDNFVQAVKSAKTNAGVRLRLVVRESARPLQGLPWEYAYLQIEKGEQNRNHFLVLHPKISLVRHPAMDAPVECLEVPDRKQINLLAVTASPAAPNLDRLDMETEIAVVSQALQGFKVDGLKLKWKPIHSDITLSRLTQLLLQKPDLFHYSGHGTFQAGAAEAQIVLEGEKGAYAPFYLDASLLAKALQAAGVRMAYLGACQTSTLTGATQWGAFAPALVAHQVPAVVAMQYLVRDDAAREFIHAFYLALAAGFSVDEAVSTGRLAVLSISEESSVQWGIPTLYLRAKDGQIFPELSQRKTDAADYVQKTVNASVKEITRGAKVTGVKFSRDTASGKYTYNFKFGKVSGELTIIQE
jgi:hypothetical protein